MEKRLRGDWESCPEFLDALDGQQLGVNVGTVFLSPRYGDMCWD